MAWDVSSHGLLTVMISLMKSNTELCEDTTSLVFYTPLLLKLFLYVIRSSFNNFPEFDGVIYMNRWYSYRRTDKSLARPGRKQATATKDFVVHISHL